MRKNINKLVAVAIGVSIMSGSIVPAFAADATTQNTSAATSVQAQTNVKPLLTLDEAIKAAISNSETLQLDQKNIDYKDKTNDLSEKMDDAPSTSGTSETSDDKKDFDKDTNDVSLKILKQQMDFDQDILIQKTTTDYNSIVTSQKQIDKAAKALEIKNKELNDAKLKNSLGLVTTTDLTATKLQIESLQNQQKSSQNTLKDAQYSFKNLIGKDVTQYSLEQDIKYNTFKIDGSVDEYLDNVIENYKTYNTQLVKLKKDYYDNADNKVSEPTKPSDDKPVQNQGESADDYASRVEKYNTAITNYTASLSNRLIYLTSKLGVYSDETTLNETKKNLKEQLRGLYTKLVTTEDSINLLKKNIELNNKQLSDAKLKYDLGLITKSEYNNLVVNSEDLDLQLRSAIDSYNTLKEDIQKPWIAFSK